MVSAFFVARWSRTRGTRHHNRSAAVREQLKNICMQFNVRIYDKMLRKAVSFSISSFIVFMVVGRLLSGVHWFSDIVGGLLLSVGLIGMYRYAVNFKKNNKE